MTPEIERLLGGYATNTLSEDERKLLYKAALDDQDLFNALEDEQALRELLADEESRREIARALRPAPTRQRRQWIWGLAATTAAAFVLVLVLVRPGPPPAAVVPTVAMNTSPQMVEAPPPPPAPKLAAPAPARSEPRKKAKAAPSNIVAETVNVQAAAPMLPGPGFAGAARQAQVASASNGFRSTAVTLGQIAPPVPFQIVRTTADGVAAELKPSESLQAGDSIQIKLRPNLPGSLTVSELSAGSLKTLAPDATIPVDRQKLIRVEWVSSTMSVPQTNFLNLVPGQPVRPQ